MALIPTELLSKNRRLQNQHFLAWSGDTTVIWRKFKYNMNRFQEDSDTASYQDINLLAMVVYDYFRTWAINSGLESGLADRGGIAMLLNKDWLGEQGYLDERGNFTFNQGADRFVHKGVTYVDSGYTDVSQADANPLLVMIILVRDNVATGQDKFNTADEPIL